MQEDETSMPASLETAQLDGSASEPGEAVAAARTSRELWEALRERAGLSLSDERDAYDNEIVRELRSTLVAGETGDLGKLLDKYGVPVERLLVQFLRAAGPFARMMSDVLVMFETASAKRSDKNLKLALDVDGLDGSLEFDIESFREQTAAVTRTLRVVQHRQWDDSGWTIPNMYGDSRLRRKLNVAGGDAHAELPRSAHVRAWLEEMSGGHRYPDLPPVPHSGNRAFDDLLVELWADFQAFQSAARDLFGSYDAIHLADVPDEYEGWSAGMLRASHDFWPRESVRVLSIIAEVIASAPDDDEALELAAEIAQLVADLSLEPVEIEVLEELLDELFNLPVWQKRHELYSVWVASVITKGLAPYSVVFHPQGDTLSFPFRPTHLATIGWTRGHRLELWSELRTPAVDPIGRKASVQPDYRLRAESSEGPREGADYLVTECKQYRRSSTRNFSAALTDYGRASADAIVSLVNYGPVSDRVMKRLPKDVADHCYAFGHVRPGGEGLPEYQRLLASLGQGVFAWAKKPSWSVDEIELELNWEGATDLDLHVATAAEECGYSKPDGIGEAHFHGDDLGTSPGPHSERITLKPSTSSAFHVVVHNFSGGSVSDVPVSVTVRWRSNAKWQSRSVDLHEAAAGRWHIASFVKEGDGLVIVNREAHGFTPGAPWSPPYAISAKG